MHFKEKFVVHADYLPVPSRRRSGLFTDPIRFLVAHDTGNPGSTARQNVRFYKNTAHSVPAGKTASAHLFVDDREIIECVPAILSRPEKAWHVLYKVRKDNDLFGSNANDAAIGVEYCYGGNIDPDKAYEKFVWVLAKLCFLYKLPPKTAVVGHCVLDPTRKTDPRTGLSHSRRSYEQLQKDVVDEYNQCLGISALPTPAVERTVGEAIVKAPLNIRSLPSRKGAIIETVRPSKERETVLIVTGKVENGEAVENNSLWYQDQNMNFFWSGGVQIRKPQPVEGNFNAAVQPGVMP